ncbi:ABC transporter substrate-binding protein [Lichenicola cladoniae]|uniref:ABC transporter substrate-binding protein n=1 Tax=Lichenicola cladoniae TaxID=1484109 RepID=A0A6M8HWL6_9PROT|nr:ABC transporter substrate-binding protein [Acetobacteraceae bacterium]QKE92710.1 ABC transporter substrate-binding protein [Lichenicola cladoniae]
MLAALVPATASVGALVLAPVGLVALTSGAQAQAPAAAFVQGLTSRLTAVVNGSGSTADKKAAILPMLSQDVDVDAIGRFCLGRFWRTATPSQQQRYLTLFHQVLVNSITGKLGDYKGVSITTGSATVQDGKSTVPTVITRPGQPTANVQWMVSSESGSPKVVDIVAEGVSLSLTQRSDYASYLAHNGNNVDALLNALSRQVSRTSS